MEKSNILFTNCEILLSSSIDRVIYLWDLIINKTTESIELIHLLTIEQEKNLSSQSIKYLSMIDNFVVANYSDQNYLHIWQLLNISIRIHDHDQWGIVEHPTKGKGHQSQIQGKFLFQMFLFGFHLAISATSKYKLFASSDTEGWIKIWDNTNSLLREISLDKTLCAIEFLSTNGELILAYQNNIHLILPENYLLNSKKFQLKQQMIPETIAEDHRLEVIQPFQISYSALPIFDYNIKTHHSKKRLQRFEQQLAG
jgi:WD40 repeat protein